MHKSNKVKVLHLIEAEEGVKDSFFNDTVDVQFLEGEDVKKGPHIKCHMLGEELWGEITFSVINKLQQAAFNRFLPQC